MILNRQRRVRVPVAELNRFVASVQKRLGVPPEGITIAFVTDDEIKRWNHAFRGKNGPTDVLSFPTDGSSEQKPRTPAKRTRRSSISAPPAHSYLGDIAIAPAVARSNARRFGRTFTIEMRILILHGILHLMGYDHETDEGQMERREARLRRELGLA
jgi:probable rRNA maturation factor